MCHFRDWDRPRGAELGALWEHLVLNELDAHVDRRRVHSWRSKHGNEVDFVLAASAPTMIECEWSVDQFDPAGVHAFRRRYPKGATFVAASDVTDAFSKRYGPAAVRFIGLRCRADRQPTRRALSQRRELVERIHVFLNQKSFR